MRPLTAMKTIIRGAASPAMAATLAATLAGCVAGSPLGPPSTVTPIVDTKPEITIPLGARVDDVVALMGHPTRGPRVDAYSELIQYTYVYPFPAVSAESDLSQGRVRTEVGNTVHLFFDRGGVLRQMGLRTDLYYPSFLDTPAKRITIAARALDVDGRQIPIVPGIVQAVPEEPLAPPPSPPNVTGGG